MSGSYIKNLQALRGIAAIMIFYHHYGFNGDVITSFGDCGVAFFMMLSGYLTYMSFARKQENLPNGESIPYGRFIFSRIIRIYPLYLLLWVVFLFVHFRFSPGAWLLGLIMMQSWVPDVNVYLTSNAVGWFVSDLIFCYILFYPTAKLMMRHPGVVAILTAIYFLAYSAVVMALPDRLVNAIIYINPMMQFASFLIGMWIYRITSQKVLASTTNIPIISDVSELLSLGLIAVAMYFYGIVPQRIATVSYWWIPVGTVILVFIRFDKGKGALNRLFHSSFMQMLGEISFGIYLIQVIAIIFWRSVIHHFRLEPTGIFEMILQSAVLLSLVIVASYLLHRYFERPVIRRLSRLVHA